MKTSHKLAIVAASILVIAAISYMIYRNAQPRPKAAIEIPTTTQEIPKPTETIPEATPQPTQTQETPKQLPVQTETTPVIAQAIANPTPETGGVEISKPVANPPTVHIIVSGTNGQYTQLCLAYKNGEAWAQTQQAIEVCQ